MFNNHMNYPYPNYSNNNYNMGMSQPIPAQTLSFVNGIEGAKGYIVPPNSSVFLMDSDSEQFFIKTADRNGMCNIKAYEYKEKEMNNNKTENVDLNQFVTKAEFQSFIEKINSIISAPVVEKTNTEQKKSLI